MPERDPVVDDYVTKQFNAAMAGHFSEFILSLDGVFKEADVALTVLGRRLAPNHIWDPLPAPEIQKEPNLTEVALARYLCNVDRWGDKRQVYRIGLSEFGTIPDDLREGVVCTLRGFASDGLPCTTLAGASSLYSDDPGLEFPVSAKNDLIYLDGESFRYDGRSTSRCGVCEDNTPYHNFTQLKPDRTPVLGEHFIPRVLSTLDGMVEVVRVV